MMMMVAISCNVVGIRDVGLQHVRPIDDVL